VTRVTPSGRLRRVRRLNEGGFASFPVDFKKNTVDFKSSWRQRSNVSPRRKFQRDTPVRLSVRYRASGGYGVAACVVLDPGWSVRVWAGVE